jgi:hypothetical protein
MEFIRGILRMTSIPASLRMASNRLGNLPSRSRIRNRARLLASSRSMARFFAACVIQDAVGCAVAPRTLIRRVACSMTASTCRRAPVRVMVSTKSQERRASAGERRKSAQVLDERSVDPGLCEDLPDGGGGDLDPEDYAAAVNVIEAERLWLGAPGAALRASDLPPIAVAWVAASRWETW